MRRERCPDEGPRRGSGLLINPLAAGANLERVTGAVSRKVDKLNAQPVCITEMHVENLALYARRAREGAIQTDCAIVTVYCVTSG